MAETILLCYPEKDYVYMDTVYSFFLGGGGGKGFTPVFKNPLDMGVLLSPDPFKLYFLFLPFKTL